MSLDPICVLFLSPLSLCGKRYNTNSALGMHRKVCQNKPAAKRHGSGISAQSEQVIREMRIKYVSSTLAYCGFCEKKFEGENSTFSSHCTALPFGLKNPLFSEGSIGLRWFFSQSNDIIGLRFFLITSTEIHTLLYDVLIL